MWVVTGATGFLGYHFLRWWQASGQPFPLRLAVRRPNHPVLAPYQGQVEVVRVNLTEPAELEALVAGAEGVLHMAATISFSPRARAYMQRTNVEATRQLVNAALERGVLKFIYISSIAALGRPAEPQALIDEQATWEPSPYNTWYGYTKYAGEKEVWRGEAEGLSVLVLNPGIILGEYVDWESGSPYFFKAIYRGLPFYPAGVNGFVGASDVVRAIGLGIEGHPHGWGQRYIAVSENLSYEALFQMIARALGVWAPRYRLSPRVALTIGWTLEKLHRLLGMPAVMTRETARTSSQPYRYDGSRLTQTFGFTYTPIEQVVQETAQFFLKTYARQA